MDGAGRLIETAHVPLVIAGELDDCQIMESECCCRTKRLSGPLDSDYAVSVQDFRSLVARMIANAVKIPSGRQERSSHGPIIS